MADVTFAAIGTTWTITTNGKDITKGTERAVLDLVTDFEKRFSRFLPDSEVNIFREAGAGKYEISKQFQEMLAVADRLRQLTQGVFDPAVAEFLEATGYDASYSLTPSKEVTDFQLPVWELQGGMLVLDGPVAFDLGGIGKGYCIDLVGELLKKEGYNYFIIEAGGDMYGTSKTASSPWRTAIQYPGMPEVAAGLAYLHNQALAVSDSFRRRWGKWHHIVNPKENRTVDDVVGAAAVAENAFFADCMTSVLFLAPKEEYATAAAKFNAQYLVMYADGSAGVSRHWPGELFV